MAQAPQTREIVIIGGGIIGCTTAYYLTRHPSYDPLTHKITLLEASTIAGGASGKAGGLLALWAYPSCIVPLSYKLHADLAAEHDGEVRWGFRKVNSGQVNARMGSGNAARNKPELASLHKRDEKALQKLKSSGFPEDLDWLIADNVFMYQSMGDPSNTAQVHPYQFTKAMAELAQERGVQIRLGTRATSIDTSGKRVSSVTYEDGRTGQKSTVSASDVILTAGPWTSRVYSKIPIVGLRAHSVTIRPVRPVSAYVLFTEISAPRGSKGGSPEIYARPNNEVYCCGEGDRLVPLPETTANVQVDEKLCQIIIDQVGHVSEELKSGEVTVKQACYLPNVSGAVAGPLVGHGDLKGLLIGAGHTCWGIQNGPATGKLLSEFVFEGEAKSADISSLDPRVVL